MFCLSLVKPWRGLMQLILFSMVQYIGIYSMVHIFVNHYEIASILFFNSLMVIIISFFLIKNFRVAWSQPHNQNAYSLYSKNGYLAARYWRSGPGDDNYGEADTVAQHVQTPARTTEGLVSTWFWSYVPRNIAQLAKVINLTFTAIK